MFRSNSSDYGPDLLVSIVVFEQNASFGVGCADAINAMREEFRTPEERPIKIRFRSVCLQRIPYHMPKPWQADEVLALAERARSGSVSSELTVNCLVDDSR